MPDFIYMILFYVFFFGVSGWGAVIRARVYKDIFDALPSTCGRSRYIFQSPLCVHNFRILQKKKEKHHFVRLLFIFVDRRKILSGYCFLIVNTSTFVRVFFVALFKIVQTFFFVFFCILFFLREYKL